MYKREKWFVLISMILLLAKPDGLAFGAEGYGAALSTLEGIQSISVRVVPVDPVFQQEGLTTVRLQRDIEKQLQKAGIKVLSEKEFNRLKRSRRYPLARLRVMTTIMELKDVNLYFYEISTKIRQAVFLARKPVVRILAPTWETRTMGHSSSLAPIREQVTDTVEQFINAYFSVNPK